MEEKDRRKVINKSNSKPLTRAEKLALNGSISPLEYFRMVTDKSKTNYATSVIDSSSKTKIDIDEKIIELKRQVLHEKEKFLAEKGDRENLERVLKELESKEKSSHIINRIHNEAVQKYLNSSEFRTNFEHGKETFAIVVSIDIRRSTELMLKAKSPTEYSDFITVLSEKLSKIIIGNFGIFDKFTGDGILAFFPSFYSGEEAILRALIAAEECHLIFHEHYKECRNKFTVFIKDVGLGIGIDCGTVSIANTSSELTVVGRPVVYACRFSGAKAGDTLLNLEPYEKLLELKNPIIKDIEETEIHIKNEGVALAFKVKIDRDQFPQSEIYPWEFYQDDVAIGTTTKEEAKSEQKKNKGAD